MVLLVTIGGGGVGWVIKHNLIVNKLQKIRWEHIDFVESQSEKINQEMGTN